MVTRQVPTGFALGSHGCMQGVHCEFGAVPRLRRLTPPPFPPHNSRFRGWPAFGTDTIPGQDYLKVKNSSVSRQARDEGRMEPQRGEMLRMGAAALAGAGVLAAVQWAERMKSAGAAREALEGSPAGEHGTPKVPVLRRAPGDVHTPQGLDRDASCDWGSPVRPSEREGNKTVSPSRLPRPRQLFSDRDHKANEVH